MNYNDKKFKPLNVSENGEVSEEVVFHYRQKGQILTCAYAGGKILHGHLLGLVDQQGNIDLRYHQVLEDGSLQTGVCLSMPEILEDGRVLLQEKWKWTSGDFSEGESVLVEI